jgi:molybdopterin synthase sulfur carrier subunit
MKFTITSYGIAKDIVGERTVVIESPASTVGELRLWLTNRYPSLIDLRSLFIAVNKNYAEDTRLLDESDEIVLIPPVSGG